MAHSDMYVTDDIKQVLIYCDTAACWTMLKTVGTPADCKLKFLAKTVLEPRVSTAFPFLAIIRERIPVLDLSQKKV